MQRRFRIDIQALRALAVAAVVVFHLWPDRLPGGYVGVDVFFVISGFLITSHLLDHPPNGVRSLLTFWARRIRRLLPAALLVLSVTLVATRLVGPETLWEKTARMTAGAALYGVNWLLAIDAIDYLAARSAPTPVQHYWSLSVEEQFYAIWPVLLLVLVALAKRTGARLGTVMLVGLGLTFAGSLVWSVLATASDPQRAYFVTPTRIWELALGGLLAAWYARHSTLVSHPDADPTTAGETTGRRWFAGPLAWIGLAVIVATCLVFDNQTPFPGSAALLPTLGAATVITARPVAGLSGKLLAFRPIQWLGDISYSVYLWHWPLIVLVPFVSGGELGLADQAGIVGLSLLLAHLTKVLVEDPARAARPAARLRWVFGLGALGMAVVLAGCFAQATEVHRRDAADAAAVAVRTKAWGSCFGANSMVRHTCPQTTAKNLVLSPTRAALDLPPTYAEAEGGKECESHKPDYGYVVCDFGDALSKTNVWLVGNSHTAHWTPTVIELAKRYGWHVETRIASACYPVPIKQTRWNPEWDANCRAWTRRAFSDIVAERPDLVITSDQVSNPQVGKPTIEASIPGYVAAARKQILTLHKAHIPLLIIRDTPEFDSEPPACVAENAGKGLSLCDGNTDEVLQADPFFTAAEELGLSGVRTLDLTRFFCQDGACPSATGGVVMYFDESHMSATYARSLAPYLSRPIRETMRQR